MVVCGGVRNVIAWQIRSYIDCNDIVILRVYYIPLPSNRVSIAFYWCFTCIYSHSLFSWWGVGCLIAPCYPLPPSLPVLSCPCFVKYLTSCYILVLKVKLQFIVLPRFSGTGIHFTIFNYHVYYWIIYSYGVLFTFAYTFIVESLGSCWTFAYICINKTTIEFSR